MHDKLTVDDLRRAPRLTSLLDDFARIASGRCGQPFRRVEPDRSLLAGDRPSLAALEVYLARCGTFESHFVASIPYILEEGARLSAAIVRYLLGRHNKANGQPTLYTLGSAEGSISRTVAQLGNGAICTLNCSPNVENQQEFWRRGAPPTSRFFLGPFFDVTPDRLASDPDMWAFRGGFDVIVEDTTFQMYCADRSLPIGLAAANLKPDGILVTIEKMRHEDPDEYWRREQQKDDDFKRRYFRNEAIHHKRTRILSVMQEREAMLDNLVRAMQPRFACAAVFWNSGNFYSIAAAANVGQLLNFLQAMIPPAIPSAFCYEILPRALFGVRDQELVFRGPEP